MSEARSELAAVIYDDHESPDEVLLAFCNDLKANGKHPVGLVQHGHCQGDQSDLAALLIHSNEEIRLFQNLGSCASGCRLDADQLLAAGSKVESAIEDGADLVVINRFGRLEREGKGLAFLIDRAMSEGIPVVIAVSAARFADWASFSGDIGSKLACDAGALHAWWNGLSHPGAVSPASDYGNRREIHN